MQGEEAIGVLTQNDLLKGLQREGELGRVANWMQAEIVTASIDEPLEQILERLQTCHCPLLFVTEAGRLAGIVNLDNIVELIKIHTALQEQGGQGQSGFRA